MSNIAILIDPHVTDRHRCRKDNFLETVIEKLDYIASQNDFVVIVGDLFHTNSNSNYIFYRIYKLFMKHAGKFYAIPGNHDLIHNNLSSLEKITIGSLALTGALNLKFDEFTIDGVTFGVSHVMKDLSRTKIDDTNTKILLGHNYLEMNVTPKESLTRDEIRKLNYKLVFLGHDHKPYDEEQIGNSTLIRMGSLTRIDTQEYNKERDICYYRVNSKSLEFERIKIPSKPSSEIFTEEAYQRIGRKKEDISFVQIGDVLAKFKKKTSGNNSLHEKLLKIATEREIEYIKSIHELNEIRYF